MSDYVITDENQYNKDFETERPFKIKGYDENGEIIKEYIDIDELQKEAISDTEVKTNDVIIEETKEDNMVSLMGLDVEEEKEVQKTESDDFNTSDKEVFDEKEENDKEDFVTESFIDLVNPTDGATNEGIMGFEDFKNKQFNPKKIESEQSKDESSGYNMEKLNKLVETNLEENTINMTQTEEKIKHVAKKVDMSNFSLVERSPIQQNSDINSVKYKGKSSYSVVLTKSGYSASMKPTVHVDARRLLYSNLDDVSRLREMYKIVHEKIHNSSFDRIKNDFNYWLKHTAAEDIETLYYGIYCSTFPNGTKLEIDCDECGHVGTYEVKNIDLIHTDDDNIRPVINKIINNVSSQDDMEKYSLINKKDTYMLDDSGIILETRTPSLYDVIDLMKKSKDNKTIYDSESAQYLLYIESAYVPVSSINGQYSQVTDKVQLLNIIDNLSLEDTEIFNATIEEIGKIQKLSYKLKNKKCASCNAVIQEQPVSIENILFTVISNKVQL